MYQPGDMVMGYPDFLIDNGVKFKLNDGNIMCANNRKNLVKYCGPSRSLIDKSSLYYFHSDKDEKEGTHTLFYKEIQGIVLESDTMGSKRPHWEGAVKILMADKIVWVWARNVRLVRLATGETGAEK